MNEVEFKVKERNFFCEGCYRKCSLSVDTTLDLPKRCPFSGDGIRWFIGVKP